MSNKKIIAVVGATGAQGGGVVQAILNDPESDFAVRAISRNPESDKSKELVALGAEVVAGDMNDVESMKNAFVGAYGAFCLTIYWESFSAEKETEQARIMATAAKHAGLSHVIWSTLEDTRKWVPLDDDRMPTIMEQYKVPHFDGKGEGDEEFRKVGVPTTFLLTSYYWDNLTTPEMGPQPGPDGVLGITFPMGDEKLPGIAAQDIGKCAYGILKAGDKYINQTIGVASEHLSGHEIAAALTEAIGKDVRYNNITPDKFRGLGFPGAHEIGNMFQFKRDFAEYFQGVRDPARVRLINPELLTFSQWLDANKDRIAND
jgi:uncharacterized protein YbjT (DUF2867 family)